MCCRFLPSLDALVDEIASWKANLLPRMELLSALVHATDGQQRNGGAMDPGMFVIPESVRQGGAGMVVLDAGDVCVFVCATVGSCHLPGAGQGTT